MGLHGADCVVGMELCGGLRLYGLAVIVSLLRLRGLGWKRAQARVGLGLYTEAAWVGLRGWAWERAG